MADRLRNTPLDVPREPLVVAAGQNTCTPLDIDANVAVAADLVFRAAEHSTADRLPDLLVLPELFLTGYELAAIVAEPARYTVHPADSRLDPLASACAQTRTPVIVGAPVRNPEVGTLHISALVLDRTGKFAGHYDKQHIDDVERAAGFSAGDGGCTIVIAGWRLGLAICWDASFPEHARSAALDGCHAYLVSAMFPGERGWRRRAIVGAARALDNAMYVVVANHCGRSGPYDGCGGSAIWAPDGVELVGAGMTNAGLAVACLDPGVLAQVRAQDNPMLDPLLSTTVGHGKSISLD